MNLTSPASQRRDYCQSVLDRKDLHQDPMQQFDRWFQEATSCDAIVEPNAMTLSTASADLHVTSRTVLLKGYDGSGFRFFTNTTSLKGKQIAENSNVALLFYWTALERQIQITGSATLLPHEATEEYFHSRPRESQLGAWASYQSAPLTHREELEDRVKELQQRFADRVIPVPDFWNGYLVNPDSIEFWQGRSSRLHDRFRYTKNAEAGWKLERLNP